MKKLILVLAILVAVPAFAYGPLDVNLVLCANDVNVWYRNADPCNLPRAFALKITLVGNPNDPNYDPNIVIKDVNDFKRGESNSTSRGYGIYPARIVILANGDVNSWGSPLADPNDPGGSKPLPGKNIILEFGSLYAPVRDWVNAPDACGILCELHFDCNGSTGYVNVVIESEDTYRGGVVFEDGCTAPPFAKTLKYTRCAAPTQPEKCFKDYNLADHNEYNTWVKWGEPNCWCYRRHCRGDADGKKTGIAWVASPDLNLLKLAYNKADTILKNVTNGICADFDHKKTGIARVASPDLNILKAYYNKAQTLVPCCDKDQNCTLDCNIPGGDKWSFWTN